MPRKFQIKKAPNDTHTDRLTIVTQTPMRVTLAGGGTDVLWYSKLKGGAWISGAINKYVYIFLNKSDYPRLIKLSGGFETAMSFDYENIPNPIIKECLRLTKITKGIEISTISDVSAKSGLGGSGSFEVGLLYALHKYKKEPTSKLKLAEEACVVEIRRLRKPIGPQDQYIAAFGGINYFEIDKNGRVSIEPLNLSFSSVKTLENNLLYFKTGILRDASSVLRDQKQKINKKDQSSDALIKMLDQIKELGFQAKKYLLSEKIDDYGETLHQHWLIKKQLSKKVTNPKIDEWYDEAIKAGASGGKIMGAGGGGWFVFYVSGDKNKFINRMKKIGLIKQRVRFDWEGAKLLIN